MYDALRASYRLRCQSGEPRRDVSVPLSGFRRLERLAGPSRPAVYRVVWACGCGQDHVCLLTHEALDYAPLDAPGAAGFWDPMTGRVGGSVARELADVAADRVRRGVWPWSFWCSAEERMRPGYPSALSWIEALRELVGIAVSCATCGERSLNLVSRRHLDEPFFHDPVVRAVERPVDEIADIERFRQELWSSRFDRHRGDLAA